MAIVSSAHKLALSLRTAYLTMHRRTDAALAECGITADQFVVLAALAEGASLTQRELVGRTSSDPNTLRAMLVLLENQGFIARTPHPTDRRARSVRLTRKGRAVFRKAWNRSDPLRCAMVQALSPCELEQLTELLGRWTAELTSITTRDETSQDVAKIPVRRSIRSLSFPGASR